MTRRSTRLDTLIAIFALALPFALPVLVVAWSAPAIVATCAPTASADLCDQPTPTPIAITAPTATAEPTGTLEPTPTLDATPTARPTATVTPAATATPTGTVTPTSMPTPTHRPSVTQPPTATVTRAVDPNIDDSVSAGFLLMGGLATVFLAVGRRRVDR